MPRRRVHDVLVDDPIPAELVPVLYRRVLDAATRLEMAGDRPTSVRIRRRAVTAYASGWDRSGARALERLEAEALSLLAAQPTTRARILQRVARSS
jgi:hypothetical protein